jgi:hypothetical protein
MLRNFADHHYSTDEGTDYDGDSIESEGELAGGGTGGEGRESRADAQPASEMGLPVAFQKLRRTQESIPEMAPARSSGSRARRGAPCWSAEVGFSVHAKASPDVMPLHVVQVSATITTTTPRKRSGLGQS